MLVDLDMALISCSLKYKLAIRKAKSDRNSNKGEALSDHLCRGDDNMFWKRWRTLQDKCTLPARIEGESSEEYSLIISVQFTIQQIQL